MTPISEGQQHIDFIVNGEVFPVDAAKDAALAVLVQRVLIDSHNNVRPLADWEVRDSEGVMLETCRSIGELQFPECRRIYVGVKVGAGAARPISEGQEKREKLATRLEAVNVSIDPNWRIGTTDPDYEADREAIAAAAAELRKCGCNCDFFGDRFVPVLEDGDKPTVKWCHAFACEVLEDGSCHCYRWAPIAPPASPQEGAQ